MKRLSLRLSIFGVAVSGCLALSGTASAVAPGAWGPSPCVVAYDYCVLVSGNTQAYCEAQLEECEQSGNGTSPQDRLEAGNDIPSNELDPGPRHG